MSSYEWSEPSDGFITTQNGLGTSDSSELPNSNTWAISMIPLEEFTTEQIEEDNEAVGTSTCRTSNASTPSEGTSHRRYLSRSIKLKVALVESLGLYWETIGLANEVHCGARLVAKLGQRYA
jgi:hypothetical protein